MTGKRYSSRIFGCVPAALGAPVFVTMADGCIVAGNIHFIAPDRVGRLVAGQQSAERVLVAYTSLPGWDDPPREMVEALPFFDPSTREEADAMPPGHWCWPRTWREGD